MTSKPPSRIHLLKVLSFLTLGVHPVTHGCVWWWWGIYGKIQPNRGDGQLCVFNVSSVEWEFPNRKNKASIPVAPGRTKPVFPTGLLLPVPAWVTDVLWFFCVCEGQLYCCRREHGFSRRQALKVSGDRQRASLNRLAGDIWWKW